MAVEIPRLRTTDRLPLVRGPRATADAFGGQVGKALVKSGEGFLELAKDEEKRAKDRLKAQRLHDLTDAEQRGFSALADLQSELATDPDFRTSEDRFETRARQLRDDVAGDLSDQVVADEFRRKFNSRFLTARTAVRTGALRQQVDAGVATLERSLDDSTRRAALATDPASEVLAREDADDAIAAAAEAGYIGPTEAGRRRRLFKARVADARIDNLILNNPAFALDGLERGMFGDLPVESRDTKIRMARVALARRGADVAAELREVRGIMRTGLEPGAERFTRLRARVAATGDAGLAAALANVEATQALHRQLRVRTPADVQAFVNAERTRLGRRESVGGAEAERLEMAERLLAGMNTEVRRDPLSWANRVGLLEVRPLTLVGDDAAPSMQARVADAHAIAAYYGAGPRFLTDEEATQLKAALGAADVDGQLAMLGQLRTGFGEDAPKVLKEVAKSSPVLAHAGGLALQSQAHVTVARDILIGSRALADNNDVLPGPADRAEWTHQVLGDTFGELPETRGAVIEAAKALYARRAIRLGLSSDQPSEELWKASLHAAAGEVVDHAGGRWGGFGAWNGRPVIIPTTLRAADFERRVRQLTDADLARLSVGGAPPRDVRGRLLRAEQLADVWLVSAGVGRYLIAATDPADGDPHYFAGSGPGGLYVLDLAADREGLKPLPIAPGAARVAPETELGPFGS